MSKLLYLLLFVTLISCRKGKVLSEDVNVQLTIQTSGSVYPTGAFPPFDPWGPAEPIHYPNYVNSESPASVTAYFKKELSDLLQHNNIHLLESSVNSGYELVITTVSAVESNNREAYIDSCAFGNPTNYVYYSDLEVTVVATLYHNGVQLETWEKKGYSSEKVRNKTDDCNAPKIRPALRDVRDLIAQVAKEVRVRVSKKLFELEG